MRKQILVGKREGIRPDKKPWRMWENNIKADLKEIRYENVGPNRAHRVPLKAANCLTR
jgi:hypothetical protein